MHDTSAKVRTRSYGWGDPGAIAAAARSLSGKDYLAQMMNGALPGTPIMATLAFRLSEVGDGRVVFACEPAEFHFDALGTVHGGLVATLIDCATGCAVHSTLPAGTSYVTVNFSVDLVKAIGGGVSALQCEGRVVRAGGRIAVADAEVTGADGTLYARGTATCLIARP